MKKFKFVINGNAYEVEVLGFEENIAKVEVNGTQYNVEGSERFENDKNADVGQGRISKTHAKGVKNPRTPVQTTNIAIKAPLPGTIITVLVKSGDKVALGQKLLTMGGHENGEQCPVGKRWCS